MLAHNPEVSELDRMGFVDPDQSTWRHLRLELPKSSGGVLEIEMIRPEAWITSEQVEVGGTLHLDMPELGAVGEARVLSLGPCPAIEAGEGEVVISTFAHPASHQILDVTFGEETGPSAPTSESLRAGSSNVQSSASSLQPIGVTETHPFWSVRDQAFVPIGKLSVGDEVITLYGESKRITSILPRPGPAERVYNLEVNGEHTYFVGTQQLLVHNNGCEKFVRYMTQAEMDDFLANGNKLAMRPGHGGYKRVVDGMYSGPGATNPKNLSSPKNKYIYKVTFQGDGGLRNWMQQNANFGSELKTTFGHPDTWEIPAAKLGEFNGMITKFLIETL
ncbi:MAG: polymorphic toxin-type HINT domain-containing protein [Pirellulaceae bacterium]